MKKLMLLAAMLAMALFAAVPAVAQVVQETGQETESGGVAIESAVENTGANSNLCPALLQAANTANLQNGQGAAQYLSEGADVEFEGSVITISPELAAECNQTIEQSAAAGPKAEAKAGKAEAKVGEAPKAEAKAEAPKAEAKAEAPKAEAKAEAPKQLPKTGGSGSASLIALSAGALLIGGGLLVRRTFR